MTQKQILQVTLLRFFFIFPSVFMIPSLTVGAHMQHVGASGKAYGQRWVNSLFYKWLSIKKPMY